MGKRIFILCSLAMFGISLFGCSSLPKSSGVLKMGPDKYVVVVADAVGRPLEAKKVAYAEANQECDKNGREISIYLDTITPNGTNELIFHCTEKK